MKSENIILRELSQISQTFQVVIEYIDPLILGTEVEETDEDEDALNVVFYDESSKNDSDSPATWNVLIRILGRNNTDRKPVWVQLEFFLNENYPNTFPALRVAASEGLHLETKEQLNLLIKNLQSGLYADGFLSIAVENVGELMNQRCSEYKDDTKRLNRESVAVRRRAISVTHFDKQELQINTGERRKLQSRSSNKFGKHGNNRKYDTDLREGLPKWKSRYSRDFEVLQLLGSGGFGAVTKVRQIYGNGVFAVKCIPILRADQTEALAEEASMLAKLHHRHIVRYYDAWIETYDGMKSGLNAFSGASQLSANDKQNALDRLTVQQKEEDEEETREYDESKSVGDVCSFDELEEFDSQELSRMRREMYLLGSRRSSIRRLKSADTLSSAELSHGRSHVTPLQEWEQFLYIQMEYCPGKTLKETIENSNLCKDRQMVWMLARQILEALAYMHDIGVVHRDLKPSNVFLSEENGEINVKIGDFGLTTTIEGNDSSELIDVKDGKTKGAVGRLSAGVGTLYYMAPELVNGEDYNQKVDMFSFGVLFFEMWHPPFLTAMELITVLSNLTRKKKFPPEFESTVDTKVLQILRNLLFSKPEERLSAAELLESPLFQVDNELQSEKIYDAISRRRFTDEAIQLMAILFSRSESSSKTRYYLHGKDVHFNVTVPLTTTVRRSWQQILRRRGAVLFHPPILQPKTDRSMKLLEASQLPFRQNAVGKRRLRQNAPALNSSITNASTSTSSMNTSPSTSTNPMTRSPYTAVCLMDSSGTLLHLPYQHLHGFALTAPFLRGSSLYRRWAFSPVYDDRDAKTFGGPSNEKDVKSYYLAGASQYPHEIHSCCYDIIIPLNEFLDVEDSTNYEKSTLAVFDAELIAVVAEMLTPFYGMLGRFVLKWTHTDFLPILLEELFNMRPLSTRTMATWIRQNMLHLTKQNLHDSLQTYVPSTTNFEASVDLLWNLLHIQGLTLNEFLHKLVDILQSPLSKPSTEDVTSSIDVSTSVTTTLPTKSQEMDASDFTVALNSHITSKSKQYQEMMDVLFTLNGFINTLDVPESFIVFEVGLNYPEHLFSNGIAFHGTLETSQQKQEVFVIGGRYEKLIYALNKKRSQSNRLAGFGFEMIAEVLIQRSMEEILYRSPNTNTAPPPFLNNSIITNMIRKGSGDPFYPRVLIAVSHKELECVSFKLRCQLIKHGITCELRYLGMATYHKLKRQHKRSSNVHQGIEWLIVVKGPISAIKSEQHSLGSKYSSTDVYFKVENLQSNEERGFSTQNAAVQFLLNRFSN